MLAISDRTYDQFRADAARDLMRRIDTWLQQVEPRWRLAEPPLRLAQLAAMSGLAAASGMESENDHAVFAWLCVQIGPDWQARLTSPPLRDVLSDPAFKPEAKLMHLDETFRPQGGAA